MGGPRKGILPRMRIRRVTRRTLAVLTSLAVLAPGALLPVVDASEESFRTVVEAEHEPGRCSVAHDHLACLQHASTAFHPLAVGLAPDPGPVRPRRATVRSDRSIRETSSLLPFSRAPPHLG